MVFEAKMRWRIERDDPDLKQEVGLGQFEGGLRTEAGADFITTPA